MKMKRNVSMKRIIAILTAVVTLFGSLIILGFVTVEKKKVYITDQTGKRWDVTQAASLGFRPGKFQYGIGMNAFTTLDDSHLSDAQDQLSGNHRVIGVNADNEAQAYSVNRLRYHEIANTHIAGSAIAAGY